MSQSQLLIHVLDVLDAVGIPYMLTGSFVSSLQGEPRATHDIDLVIDLAAESVKRILEAFSSPGFYLDESAMYEAVVRKSTFNLIDYHEGDKVDFWLLTEEPFDRSRFARRRSVELLGRVLFVSSPEDTILAKLRWAKLSGGSMKQFTDAVRVFEVQYGTLDIAYLADWVNALGIADFWRRLQEEAEPVAWP